MPTFNEVLNFGNGFVVNLTLNSVKNSDGSYTVTAASGTDLFGNKIIGLDSGVDGDDHKVWIDGVHSVVDFGGLTLKTNGTPNGAKPSLHSPAADINIYYNNGQYLVDTATPTVINTPTVTCFLAGVRIATPEGEAPVETLKRGDLVLTHDGRAVPVAWVGRQTVSTLFAPRLRVLPIHIRAGALGEGVPKRDLFVSPDHALLIGDILVHAGALVNDASITRESETPPMFVYYHVETDEHALILAEGAPAETFVDNVDRLGFDNWSEYEALYPQGRSVAELLYPRAKAWRQVPPPLRALLAERAKAIGAAAEEAAVA